MALGTRVGVALRAEQTRPRGVEAPLLEHGQGRIRACYALHDSVLDVVWGVAPPPGSQKGTLQALLQEPTLCDVGEILHVSRSKMVPH